MRLVKGHATENDFLLLVDLDGRTPLEPSVVRALCDRHAGFGADGVIRVVRSGADPDARAMAADAEYFMDYRNADGSLAEMCGNGIRVFMRYLNGAGLVEQDAAVATRGGIRRVRAHGDGNVTVHMGLPRVFADRPIATAAHINSAPSRLPGTPVAMPNPHVVVALTDPAELLDLDLRCAPSIEPPLPQGQNVEFFVPVADRHVVMRVHERGVGETRSCGTGICAVAVVAALAAGQTGDSDGLANGDSRWRVDVAGGTCWVDRGADGEVELTGPAELVGEVEVDEDWLQRAIGRGQPASVL